MGDVAMVVPALQALIKNNPSVQVTVLTRPQFAAIFNGLDRVEVFAADVKGQYKGLNGLWLLFRALQQMSFTEVADLHNVLRSKLLGLGFQLSGLRVVRMNKGRHEKKRLTRKRNKHFKPLKTTVARYETVFGQLGFSMETEKQYFLPKPPLTKSLRNLMSGQQQQQKIGIAPFAAHEGKMYRLKLMEEVIQLLLSQTQGYIYLFGGGSNEVKQLQQLSDRSGSRVYSVAGVLSFEEELALISNLQVMLAMDSGNAHLAANYGIPVVTLWGVTHPYAGFAPYAQHKDNALVANRASFPLIPTSVYGNTYPKGYEEAINTIDPKTVVERLLEVIS